MPYLPSMVIESSTNEKEVGDLLPSQMGKITFNEVWKSMEREQKSREEDDCDEAVHAGFEWIRLEDAIYAHSLQSSMDSYTEALNFQQTLSLAQLLDEHLSGPCPCPNPHLANTELVVPSHIFERLAGDVSRLARDEPYGVSGCEMVICVQRADVCVRLDAVCLDPYTTPTFEVRITLQEDTKRRWFSPRYLASKLNPRHVKTPLFVRQDYKLEKKQFYRSLASSLTT